jgi:hypothetical protein
LGALGLLPMVPPVLGQLVGNGREQFGTDQSRDGNLDLVFDSSWVTRRMVARLLGLPPRRTQPRAAFPDAGLAEDCFPLVGRVGQQLANREHVPGFSLRAGNALSSQPAPDFGNDRRSRPNHSNTCRTTRASSSTT